MRIKGIDNILKSALKEDIGRSDITTAALFPKPIKARAKIIAKQKGVVCGLSIVEALFKILDKKMRIVKKVKEGAAVRKGKVVCIIEGDARKILTGERTALNFLGRLSGIATLAREYVNKVRPYKVKIMDTRKTTPGLRRIEKYAVRAGGGCNHRMGLWDQVLVKDNHIAVYEFGVRSSELGVGSSLKSIIQKIKKRVKKSVRIEIETQSLKEFKDAIKAKPDIIMMDNMAAYDIKRAVVIRNKLQTPNSKLQTKLEASGGVTLKNIRAIAKTGVDMISIGSLTHSAKSLDFSLEIV